MKFKHNEVLHARLSDLGYYMPFDYEHIKKTETRNEIINLTIDWLEIYTYYLAIYIDSCEDSNPFDINMDKYCRQLHVNRIKMCGLQNQLMELLKNNKCSRLKTFILVSKTASLITKTAYIVYSTNLFED
jgi:hypothetical protein